ncbi:hypothetical protein KL919_004617 [Ogataea angusta]|nr:hypothetical protein KL919_004617 [Ogataea angusta]
MSTVHISTFSSRNSNPTANVSQATSEDQIVRLAGSFGTLSSVSLQQEKSDNTQKAKVVFQQREDAQNCIENLHGYRLDDHYLMTRDYPRN